MQYRFSNIKSWTSEAALLFSNPASFWSGSLEIKNWAIGGDVASSDFFVDLSKIGAKFGEFAKHIGPSLSTAEAAYTVSLSPTSGFGEKASALGKAVVDWGMYGAEKVSTKFGPIGWAYTAADFALSFVDYKVKYGPSTGQSKSGWESLLYMDSDQRLDMYNFDKNTYQLVYGSQ